jgi:DNA replication protein DnaC
VSPESPWDKPVVQENYDGKIKGSSSFVITSNRAVDEWLGLFDDPILGNSTLDRLANTSYQIVLLVELRASRREH